MKTICVDFDGVIHSYESGWQGWECIPDPSVKGAITWLYHMSKAYDVCIFSTRSQSPEGIAAMRNAIERWALEMYMTGQELKDFLGRLRFPTNKPPAVLTIDDRAFCFQGTFPTKEEIEAFKPWNKR